MITGVDISAWQSDRNTPAKVDFVKMAGSGAKFAFFRAQFGLMKDVNFDEYVANSKGLLKRGAYYFPIMAYNLDTQTKQFCDMLEGLNLELPPVIDIENYNGVPSAASIKVMVKTIESRLGVKPIIYTGYYVWRDNVKGSSETFFADYPLWIATYSTAPMIPKPWTNWTFWQYTDKGDGVRFGVESLNIDMDSFNGTQSDFDKLTGENTMATNPTVTTAAAGPANPFAKYARGFMVWKNHISADLGKLAGKYDYIVSVAIDPERNQLFTTQCQWAADLNIPFIALFKPYMGDYPGIGSAGVSEEGFEHWPKPEKDANFQALDKQVFSGTAKRRIHAIIIDARDTFQSDGKLLPAAWVAKTIQYFEYVISERYKIPWYVLVDGNLLKYYPGSPEISNLFSGDTQGTSIQFLTAVDAGGYPVASPNAAVPYSTRWYWWWYAAASIAGINSGVTEWLYAGTRAALYKELGFAAVQATPEGGGQAEPAPTPVVDGSAGADAKAALSLLDLIIAQLATLRNLLRKLLGV